MRGGGLLEMRDEPAGRSFAMMTNVSRDVQLARAPLKRRGNIPWSMWRSLSWGPMRRKVDVRRVVAEASSAGD